PNAGSAMRSRSCFIWAAVRRPVLFLPSPAQLSQVQAPSVSTARRRSPGPVRDWLMITGPVSEPPATAGADGLGTAEGSAATGAWACASPPGHIQVVFGSL